MEERLIRVGITQGDMNGVGYEVILKTFAEEMMTDICTPVIYGSLKALQYYRDTLTDITEPVIPNVIARAEEAQMKAGVKEERRKDKTEQKAKVRNHESREQGDEEEQVRDASRSEIGDGKQRQKDRERRKL